ncbi:MAG: VOC family protein [Sandaracinus sp.]
MEFVSIRIVTADVSRLARFYERITGIAPRRYTDDFVEIETRRAVIAIAHERTMAMFADGAARPASNRSVILELRVEDVDATYARLAPELAEVLQPPTTMPWGNRSLLFRDPDGNLVNFFQPRSEAARARFERA